MELTDHEKTLLKLAMELLEDVLASRPIEFTSEDHDAMTRLTHKLWSLGVR